MGTGMIWIIFIGIAAVSWLVQMNLQNKFKKYSKIPTGNGMTGADVALKMLHDNGIYDVTVTHTPGHLTDHYNPANKTVNLSESVTNACSSNELHYPLNSGNNSDTVKVFNYNNSLFNNNTIVTDRVYKSRSDVTNPVLTTNMAGATTVILAIGNKASINAFKPIASKPSSFVNRICFFMLLCILLLFDELKFLHLK